jgi:glycosyltransferase involved in cell wall biosynthesis
MTNPSRVAAADRTISRLADWEEFFTTRDGALTDLADVRGSLSWRVTGPLRRATSIANRLLGSRGGGDNTALRRLELRLRTAAPLIDESGRAAAQPELGELLEACAGVVARSRERSLTWLLFVAVSGALPNDDDVLALERELRREAETPFGLRTLRVCGPKARLKHTQLRTIRIETERSVVLVDFAARHGFNSGIQRVTREVARRWQDARPAAFVAMTEDPTGLRELDADERLRVFDWSSERFLEKSEHEDDPLGSVVVPWKTTFFLPEVPTFHQNAPLAALARHSGNRVAAVGYDAIPVSSGTDVPIFEAVRFGTYLSILRHSDLVIGISETSAEEFRGFADALHAQGLAGPAITSLPLPVESLDAAAQSERLDEARPVVLAVGSHEPRKNQIALIYAAEVLWREGLDFELVLLGGRGPRDYHLVHDAAAALTAAGRPVTLKNHVTDDELASAYRAARFSVFVSLHEGYGLPVAESLAAGTPVLTSNYGSTAEIAERGGCLTVDPRDDDEIVAAMRRMLTDDALVLQLRADIARRQDPNWDDYSAQLWDLAHERAA